MTSSPSLVTRALKMLTLFLPLFVAYLLLVVVMRRGLSTLLGSLSATTTRLSNGDFDDEVQRLDRSDELGQMSGALITFRQAGLDKAQLAREAAEARHRVEQEERKREQERASEARQQASVVHEIATGLEKLSDGDLSYRVTAAFPPASEKLRNDFNTAIAKLEDTLRVVLTNTKSIHAGSGEIKTATDDLSRRTEQQAASLEQSAAALSEITSTTRKTSEDATHAKKVVSSAKSEAENSGIIVNQAVEAMTAINRSSDEIGQIIGMIDEIAFQTNLLALNAGVEAARAGDSGRGFAVVASEVRALAQRSATAAKDIKQLVTASTGHVRSGVKLVGETGQALGRIVTQVTQLDGLVAAIATAAGHQATGLAEVNVAVNQMDQVTQQNAAMVEQTTAASGSLARETESLAALVSRFRINNVAAAPERTPAKNTAKPGRLLPFKPVRQATPRALATAGRPDWEEM